MNKEQDTKICSVCNKERLIGEFTKRKSSPDGHNASCMYCTRTRTKEHYLANKSYYRAKNKRRRQESRRKLYEYKKKLECVICGENRYICLDFHHPENKIETIANIHNRGWSWERTLEEISKCTVLCSNCHRIIHNDEDLEGEQP